MHKLQLVSPKTESAVPLALALPVFEVSEQREADVAELDSDLMAPSCLGPDSQQGESLRSGLNLIMEAGELGVTGRFLVNLDEVSTCDFPQAMFQCLLGFGRRPGSDGEVGLADLSPLKGTRNRRRCGLVFGYHHDTAGGAIQAVQQMSFPSEIALGPSEQRCFLARIEGQTRHPLGFAQRKQMSVLKEDAHAVIRYRHGYSTN